MTLDLDGLGRRAYGVTDYERPWVEGSPPDSYSNSEYHVAVHVWKGSPPKGYVLSTPHFTFAVGVHGNILRKFESWHSIKHLRGWERKALIDLRRGRPE